MFQEQLHLANQKKSSVVRSGDVRKSYERYLSQSPLEYSSSKTRQTPLYVNNHWEVPENVCVSPSLHPSLHHEIKKQQKDSLKLIMQPVSSSLIHHNMSLTTNVKQPDYHDSYPVDRTDQFKHYANGDSCYFKKHRQYALSTNANSDPILNPLGHETSSDMSINTSSLNDFPVTRIVHSNMKAKPDSVQCKKVNIKSNYKEHFQTCLQTKVSPHDNANIYKQALSSPLSDHSYESSFSDPKSNIQLFKGINNLSSSRTHHDRTHERKPTHLQTNLNSPMTNSRSMLGIDSPESFHRRLNTHSMNSMHKHFGEHDSVSGMTYQEHGPKTNRQTYNDEYWDRLPHTTVEFSTRKKKNEHRRNSYSSEKKKLNRKIDGEVSDTRKGWDIITNLFWDSVSNKDIGSVNFSGIFGLDAFSNVVQPQPNGVHSELEKQPIVDSYQTQLQRQNEFLKSIQSRLLSQQHTIKSLKTENKKLKKTLAQANSTFITDRQSFESKIVQLQDERDSLLKRLTINNEEREQQEVTISEASLELEEKSKEAILLKSEVLHYRHVAREAQHKIQRFEENRIISANVYRQFFGYQFISLNDKIPVCLNIGTSGSGTLGLRVSTLRHQTYIDLQQIVQVDAVPDHDGPTSQLHLQTVSLGLLRFQLSDDISFRGCFLLLRTLCDAVRRQKERIENASKTDCFSELQSFFFGSSTLVPNSDKCVDQQALSDYDNSVYCSTSNRCGPMSSYTALQKLQPVQQIKSSNRMRSVSCSSNLDHKYLDKTVTPNTYKTIHESSENISRKTIETFSADIRRLQNDAGGSSNCIQTSSYRQVNSESESPVRYLHSTAKEFKNQGKYQDKKILKLTDSEHKIEALLSRLREKSAAARKKQSDADSTQLESEDQDISHFSKSSSVFRTPFSCIPISNNDLTQYRLWEKNKTTKSSNGSSSSSRAFPLNDLSDTNEYIDKDNHSFIHPILNKKLLVGDRRLRGSQKTQRNFLQSFNQQNPVLNNGKYKISQESFMVPDSKAHRRRSSQKIKVNPHNKMPIIEAPLVTLEKVLLKETAAESSENTSSIDYTEEGDEGSHYSLLQSNNVSNHSLTTTSFNEVSHSPLILDMPTPHSQLSHVEHDPYLSDTYNYTIDPDLEDRNKDQDYSDLSEMNDGQNTPAYSQSGRDDKHNISSSLCNQIKQQQQDTLVNEPALIDAPHSYIDLLDCCQPSVPILEADKECQTSNFMICNDNDSATLGTETVTHCINTIRGLFENEDFDFENEDMLNE